MASASKNKDLSSLYKAVGAAISSWTYIELQLHQIFAICLSLTVMQPGGGFSADTRIPNAVLDAIEGFRGQLNMIDAAMSSALDGLDEEAKALLRDWADLRKKVNGLHWNRNALAHWTAMRDPNADGTTARAYIAPRPYRTKEHNGVTETDIGEWAIAFGVMGGRLAAFVERLASYRGLQQRHLERAAGQIRCSLPGDPTLLEQLKEELAGYL